MFAFTYIGVKVDNSIYLLTLIFAFTYHRMGLIQGNRLSLCNSTYLPFFYQG
jgi:hypothetical protein